MCVICKLSRTEAMREKKECNNKSAKIIGPEKKKQFSQSLANIC